MMTRHSKKLALRPRPRPRCSRMFSRTSRSRRLPPYCEGVGACRRTCFPTSSRRRASTSSRTALRYLLYSVLDKEPYPMNRIVIISAALLVSVAGCRSSATTASGGSGPTPSSSVQERATSSPPRAPSLARPPLSAVPSSYAQGAEDTLDPSDKSDPQGSSAVDGFNWWPGLGPNGSLGVVRTVAVGVDGVVYEKTWGVHGKLANSYKISCSGADEIVREYFNAGVGVGRVPAVNIGKVPGACPGLTPWSYLLSEVMLNRWTHNVVN
jgi:hypothetical protein